MKLVTSMGPQITLYLASIRFFINLAQNYALIHRDYFINDAIKIFVFENRIEIISPGKLPNSLTEEQIKRGVRRSRNHIIASLAPDILEYRGAGSGILRALQAYPHIEFINEQDHERFIVRIHRPPKTRSLS